jgi:hypothetical protein
LSLTDRSVLHLDPKAASYADGTVPNFRSANLLSLLEPIAQYLPDKVEFTTSVHDLGSTALGEDQREFLEEKIQRREYASEDELKPFENIYRHKEKGIAGIAVSWLWGSTWPEFGLRLEADGT